MVLSGKSLGAISALEGCLSGVLAHVIDKMLSAREWLRAEVAAMRRLACMLPDVIQ